MCVSERRNLPAPYPDGKAPKPIVFPEDRLIQSYMARHPEAKMVPIWLNGEEQAPARVFATRQLQLIEVGPQGSRDDSRLVKDVSECYV